MTIILPGVDMVGPGGNNNSVGNYNASAATPAAATETVLAGSQIVLPAGGLQVGTRITWTVSLTKTAAGVGHTDFLIKTNTGLVVATGTTGGAATLATITGDTETAAIDTAQWTIDLVITAVSLAAGTAKVAVSATNAAAATAGYFAGGVRTKFALITAVDTSGDILSIGLAINAGAADVTTVNYVRATAQKLAVTGI